MRVLLGLMVAGLLAGSFGPVHAQQWCGFHDKDRSRVRCGFTSVQDCKAALGHKKGAVCMPNPSFAMRPSTTARIG